ncbi:hypothetical protein D3C87_1377040 [compost metagenome]
MFKQVVGLYADHVLGTGAAGSLVAGKQRGLQAAVGAHDAGVQRRVRVNGCHQRRPFRLDGQFLVGQPRGLRVGGQHQQAAHVGLCARLRVGRRLELIDLTRQPLMFIGGGALRGQLRAVANHRAMQFAQVGQVARRGQPQRMAVVHHLRRHRADEAAAIASAPGIDQLPGAQGIQGLAHGHGRHAHQA